MSLLGMHRSRALRLFGVTLFVYAFTGIVAAQVSQGDADVPRGPKPTSEDILRWLVVEDAELVHPNEEYRELAKQIAAGSTDARVLRAYARLHPRLYPFDFVTTAQQRLDALDTLL